MLQLSTISHISHRYHTLLSSLSSHFHPPLTYLNDLRHRLRPAIYTDAPEPAGRPIGAPSSNPRSPTHDLFGDRKSRPGAHTRPADGVPTTLAFPPSSNSAELGAGAGNVVLLLPLHTAHAHVPVARWRLHTPLYYIC
ncbi:hypothetical protein PsYK624_141270 [Phanerochaete sordida]|uniref:Uncharacterized protein n=1 Tax=Phanerochaete sordida TaxID=48140 RepID=A0A9P3GQZ2_9APHY|nr:hypothetical protein PsYK624_141270 [Phanerochaete sordida]